ncbi:hypothetical protein, partial [Noviherbaspirillum autotrophicum]
SGEYLVDFFFMAPFSQILEPPRFPGRFIASGDRQMRSISRQGAGYGLMPHPTVGLFGATIRFPRLAMQERNGHLGQADDQQGGDHPSKAGCHVDPGSKTNASQEFHIAHSPLGDKPHEQNTGNPCPTVRKEQESLN